MIEKIRNLIALSSNERKGVLALILIILIISGLNVYVRFRGKSESLDKNFSAVEINNLQIRFAPYSDTIKVQPLIDQDEDNSNNELFYFDPNKASSKDLKRLGMNNRQITALTGYRKHGGKFRQKEDLKKIYGMNTVLYNRLLPYIRIDHLPVAEFKIEIVEEKDIRNGIIDINRADSASLVKLYGIGPVLSRRIVKYRTLLGGFYQIGQLGEVYGVHDSIIFTNLDRLSVDTSLIIKINLNEVTEENLTRHPYIGSYLAKGIIKYRSKVKEIRNIDELRKNGLIPGNDFERLKRYLRI